MTTKILPSAERVRELLHYDPLTGVFTWLVRTAQRIKVGDVAGCFTNMGYQQIGIDGRQYLSHRLAWVHTHGEWPVTDLDHRDGDHANNRLNNLRECSHAENMHNRRTAQKNNKSGFLGVTWQKRDKKWRAGIKLDRKTHHLGYFPTAEEAHTAYLRAKKELHPFGTLSVSP